MRYSFERIVSNVTEDMIFSIFESDEVSSFMSNNNLVDWEYCDFGIDDYEENEEGDEFTFVGEVTIEGSQEGGFTGVTSCWVKFYGRVSCNGILLEAISITSLEWEIEPLND